MAEEFRIEGLDELYRALQELPGKLGRNIMRGAIRAGARVVADEAKRLAPVLKEPDPGRQAGALAKSVHVMSPRVKGDEVSGGVIAGGKTTVGRGENKVQADAFYAYWIEYGTAKMGPHPFMRPAIDTRAGAAVDAAVDYIRGRVEAGDLK